MKKSLVVYAALSLLLLTACKKERNALKEALPGKGGNSGSKAPATCPTSPNIIKNIQADFGALGNGSTDDTRPFLRAAQWINANSTPGSIIELQIPPGNYIVGAQLVPNDTIDFGTGFIQNTIGVTLMGVDIMALTNVSDVRIVGVPSANITYKSNLNFGGMTAAATNCDYVQSGPCLTCGSSADQASVGIFLKILNSSCVYVSGLHLEGNAQACNLRGFYNECTSRQLPYDGFVILGGSDITLDDVSARHFGRDGVMTANSGAAGGDPANVTIQNSQFIGNCRQGFSFTGGNGVTLDHCDFDSTGHIFKNNPGCGVDIEPDWGSTCTNGTFNYCNFRHNIFVGMISDNKFPDVSNMTFNYCEFFASDGDWSIWPNRMINTAFNNCTIKGHFCHVAGSSASDHMLFQSCAISDWDGSFSSQVAGWNGILMDLGAPGAQENIFFEFLNCTMDVHHSKLVYMDPRAAPALKTDRIFHDNVMTMYIADLKTNVTGHPPIGWPTGLPTPQSDLGSFYTCHLVNNRIEDSSPISYPPYSPPPGAPLFYQQCFWIGFMNDATQTPTWCCNCSHSIATCVCTIPKLQKLNTSDGTNYVPNTAFNGPVWSRIGWNTDQQCLNGGTGGYF